MKSKFFVVTAVLASSLAYAQDTTRILDEVVVTTNKYLRKQSETGKIITVITKEVIEKSQGKSMGELLNTVTGTTIIGANNNPGTNNTASIRGASAGNTLILLDGIPLNDPSVNNNYFDLNYFPIDQVERIEILKGGQSTLYGSDAVAGVINIISKKAVPGKLNLNGGLTAGSYNTFKQYFGVSGTQRRMDYSVNYTHLSSKGFSSAYDSSKTAAFDKDGFDQHVADARLGFKITGKWRADIYGSYSYYRTDLDAAAFTDEKDYHVKNDNVRFGAGLKYDHNKGILRFNYSFNYVARDYLDDSTYKSSPFVDFWRSAYIGRTHYAEVYNNWKWNHYELLAGVDYRLNNTYQFYSSTGPFGPYDPPAWRAKMNQLSPYASLISKINNFTGEVGARLNIHSEYGTNFTYTVNPSFLVRNKVKLFANFYSAFKTPTLYQLFDPVAGNKELDPEKGITGEAGIELFPNTSLRFRIVGFYRKTKDAILYMYNPLTYESRYLNASEQKNYGFESELSYVAGKLGINANYAYTDGETTAAYDGTGAPLTKDTTYYNLYRIPKHAVNINAGFKITQSLYVSSTFRYVSEREEFIYGAAPEQLDSYATVDLYGEYKFRKIIKIFVDLRNITDKEYFDLLGYNSKRFNLTGGVVFSW
jgi:vitamin B12 transporter